MELIFNKPFKWRKRLISKADGFNQTALDQTARQGFANAQFEVNSEGLDLVEEFYSDENQKGTLNK
jgi:hypothetical protein